MIFASANPRATALTPCFDANGNLVGALIAGPEGVTIGQFSWVEADGVTVNNNGGSHYSPEAIEARREEAKKLLSYFTLEDKIEYLAMCDRARARQAAEEQGQQIAAAPAAEVQAQDASPAVDQLQSANAEIEDDEGGEDG